MEKTRRKKNGEQPQQFEANHLPEYCYGQFPCSTLIFVMCEGSQLVDAPLTATNLCLEVEDSQDRSTAILVSDIGGFSEYHSTC